MDVLDILLGGALGFILVSVLPNDLISWTVRMIRKNDARGRKI
jgi:hypothetical protein